MIKEGDFVSLNYLGRVKESGEIFDLTSEADAKKYDVYNKNAKYGFVTIVMGAAHILKGIDDALIGKKEGDSFKIELKPEQAFGERKPELIKLIPAKYFKKDKVEPYVGMKLNVDNAIGTIRSITGGRIVVDFNNPLAGRAVEYEIRVEKVVTDVAEQVKGLAKLYSGLGDADFDVKTAGESTEILLKLGLNFEIEKKISEDVKKYIKTIKLVRFVNEF